MPITPTLLAKRRTPVAFDCAGETVHLEYYPAALSAESLTELRSLQVRLDAIKEDGPDADAAMLDYGTWICKVLAAWDYCEDNAALGPVGEPIPITPERIVFETKRFGDFVRACMVAVVEDYRQGKASGADSSRRSGATSSPTGRSPSSRATGRSRKRSA